MTLPEHFKLMMATGPGIGKIVELLPLIFIFGISILSSILKNKKTSGPPARPYKKPQEPTVKPAGSREFSRQAQLRPTPQRQPGRVIAVPQPPKRAKTIRQNVRPQAKSTPVGRGVKRNLRAQSPKSQVKPTQQVSVRPLIPHGRNGLAQAVIYAEILGKPLALRSDQNDLHLF